jgi:hypothetical protein
MGSWKIIEIRAPRNARSFASLRFIAAMSVARTPGTAGSRNRIRPPVIAAA